MAAKSELVFSKLESSIKASWDKDDHKELRLLVTGKTGEGKSTLVNGLLGKHVAKEGAGSERCTTQVAEHKADIEGVPVTVFDSPGLQDATENEDDYLEDMKKKCHNLSLVLYCTKMTNNRLKEEDKRAIVKLTHAFGQNFWKFAVLVLTFANMENVSRRDERDEDEGPEPRFNDDAAWKELEKKRFEGRVKLWKDSFHKFLIEDVGVREDIVERILVVPVGDSKESRENQEPYRLPDRDDWFSEFWLDCSLRVREMKLFIKINKSRFIQPTDKSIHTEDDFVKVLVKIFAKNYTLEELLEAFNSEESPVQDSTLQLSDAPKVDETYSQKLRENIKKMDREAWVKEKEEKNKEEEQKNERDAEANRREREDITERKIALDRRRARMLAKEAVIRAHPTVVLPPPRPPSPRPPSPSWCFLL